MKKSDFINSKTILNLAKIYTICSTLNTRLKLLSSQCIQEGYNNISDLLKKYSHNQIAFSEVIMKYITNCTTDMITEIEVTIKLPCKKNIEIFDSLHYITDIYNEIASTIFSNFALQAEEEDYLDINKKIFAFCEVCKNQAKELNNLAKLIKANKLYKYNKKTTIVCTNCGYKDCLTIGWKKCPICNYPSGYIKQTKN